MNADGRRGRGRGDLRGDGLILPGGIPPGGSLLEDVRSSPKLESLQCQDSDEGGGLRAGVGEAAEARPGACDGIRW